jgi:hypothetical protein
MSSKVAFVCSYLRFFAFSLFLIFSARSINAWAGPFRNNLRSRFRKSSHPILAARKTSMSSSQVERGMKARRGTWSGRWFVRWYEEDKKARS